jgi:hypothetical protein
MTQSPSPFFPSMPARSSLPLFQSGWLESLVFVGAGAGLLLAVTWSAFGGQFFGEDFITRSLYLSAGGDVLKAIFTPFGPFFRPAAVAWSMGTQLVLPFDPFVHHLRNFLFLLVIALLLHRILLRLTASPLARGLGLALFLVSGVQLTIVGYINCIDNIGALTYGLAALLFIVRYHQGRQWWNYAGALVFFLFSTFSRDINVMFLCALAVLIAFQAREDGVRWLRPALVRLAPFVGIVLLYFAVRGGVVGLPPLGGGAGYSAYTPHFDPVRILHLSLVFIGTLLNLSFGELMGTGQGDLSSLLGLSGPMQAAFRTGFVTLGGLLVLATVVLGLRARPWGLFALAWAGAMLLPTFLIQNQQIYYDFEPLAACALLLAISVDRAVPCRRWLVRAWLPVLGVVLVNGIAHAGNVSILAWRFSANQDQAIIDQVMIPHRGEKIAALTLIAPDRAKADFLSYLVDPPLSPSGDYQAQLKALMSPEIRYFRAVAEADYQPDPNAPQPHLIYRQEPDGRTLTRIDAGVPRAAAPLPARTTALAPVIEAFGPTVIAAGSSPTLWMKASVVRPGMVILWNGHPLASAVDTGQRLVTAEISQSLLAEPGTVSLSLRDPATNRDSAAVTLERAP